MNFTYDRASVQELLENYINSEEGLGKFHGSRSEFYRRLKRCQKIVIGRRTLILKDDFLRFMIDDRDGYKNRTWQRKVGYAGVKNELLQTERNEI